MRRFLYGSMATVLLMTLSGLPAYGYGGGPGDGGDPLSNMGPSTSGGSIVPAGFTPIDMEFVSPAPPSELSSVGETPVTGGPRQLSEEELQELSAAFEFIMVTAGGIIIGYATGGAGWTVLGQAAAGGAWSGTTSYVLSDDDNPGEQAVDAAFQDFAVGFVPVPPPAQAAISYGITQIREQIPARPYRTQRQHLEHIADPRPRPLQ
ncbi:MAG: hypothetical protein HF981_23715 [Desulfobacteraceae bacterium]|nr:hypothetical protein [Desulfobacteraceae bacterium]MBC2753426.1 hypothetical protein [Desulfobacteraceae bacterium]